MMFYTIWRPSGHQAWLEKKTSHSSMIFPTKPPLLMGISLLSMFERRSSFMWIYERFCMGLYGLIWSYWILILGENKPLTWVPVSWVNRNSWMFIPPIDGIHIKALTQFPLANQVIIHQPSVINYTLTCLVLSTPYAYLNPHEITNQTDFLKLTWIQSG